MRTIKNTIFGMLILSFIANGCTTMSRTKKGAAIGTVGGGAIGAVVGRASGNTALGAIIGAAVGGVAGAVIGTKMDKQAAEIKNTVPGAKVTRVGEGIVVEFNSKILFAFDKSELSDGAKGNLDNLVTILNKYPETNIEIQGHTDNVGADQYNKDLSERRAMAVSGYITQRGISSGRVTTKPYGESAPNYSNETEEGRAQNRRVEFMITAN